MKKIILFATILLGIGANSYGIENEKIDLSDVNKTFLKEMTSFYGGYDEIYSEGINEENIMFILNETDYNDENPLKFDFDKLKDGQIIEMKLDEVIELDKISNLNKLKVIGKTHKNSVVHYKKDRGKLIIDFSSVGEYKVVFTDKKQKTKIITFRKKEKFMPSFDNLDENIEKSYGDNDVDYLNNNLIILKTFYPDSDKIKTVLFYALELNEKNKKYENVRKISETLVSNFELDDKKKSEIIESYLMALKKLNEIDEYLNFLEKLSDYDDEYKSRYLNESIEYKNYNHKALELAKESVELNPTSKVKEYLGDYYYQLKNYKMAIYYYELDNNITKLATVYLEIGDKASFERLKSNATKNQMKELHMIEDRYLDSQKIEEYIGTAERYIKEGRLQEAELYYLRILKTNVSYELKNDIYYKLADVYYKLEEFELGKKYLSKIDSKALNKEYLGDYYYLGGMIYYNLKEYNKSANYFSVLSKKFPNTPLSNRGKIYLLKIKKLQK